MTATQWTTTAAACRRRTPATDAPAPGGVSEAGPSIALQRRRCRLHTSSGWESFCRKYRAELAEHEDLLCLLDDLLCRSRLTLLFDASDASHNGAVILRDVLNERRARGGVAVEE